MRSFYSASCTGQYSSAPDGVLRVFAADESVAYNYPVTTLAEIKKAIETLSLEEKEQLLAKLLVSLRKTEGELPPPRLYSPAEIATIRRPGLETCDANVPRGRTDRISSSFSKARRMCRRCRATNSESGAAATFPDRGDLGLDLVLEQAG